GVANTVDPVGGSWAIEAATTRIEQEARDLIAEIDARGGALGAIESGFAARQIQESAYRAQQALDGGEAIVVGVNRYESPVGPPRGAPRDGPGIFRIDPDVERRQIERVRAVRASRSERDCRDALAGVERAARGADNLMPPIIEAVEKRATLGEVSDSLRRVFGEFEGGAQL
ncbi:MAG TPA: methylmalonyl-CoA mutase family protein, partial [Methylomirabilota bacterium]